MNARIGIAVGTLFALGLPAPAVAQDAPPLQRPFPDLGADSRFSIFDSRFFPPQFPNRVPGFSIENRESRIENQPESTVTLSGSVRLEAFFRDEAIEDLRARVGSLAPPFGGDTLMTGEGRVRLDLRAAGLRCFAELATLPYDGGLNLPLGRDGPDLLLRQLAAELEELPVAGLALRVGAFDYSWKIRPHGEPFLLDLGRAESFFSGVATREMLLPAGARLAWRAGDFVQVEGAWMTAIEGGAAARDESLAALLVNFPLSERSAVFLGALRVAGTGDGRVSTWGGGADAYFGPDREIELFGEGWLQSGRLSSGVSKRAWGAHAGARVATGPWRAEVSGAWRSGDGNPADGRDETFQSYEGQERFRIVESAEFGLDWDANVSSARLAVTRRLGERAELRVDAARFRLLESPFVAGGAPLGIGRDLGTEVDATLSCDLSAAVAAWIAVAALFDSEALESAGRNRDDHALLVALGVRAQW